MQLRLGFAAPVLLLFFSESLNEIVRIFRWIAIITGLVDDYNLKPGTDLFSFYAIYPILFCIGFGVISKEIKTFIYRTRLSNVYILLLY